MWSGKVEQDEGNGSVGLGAAANPDMNCGEVLKKPGPGPGRRKSMCKALRQDRAGALAQGHSGGRRDQRRNQGQTI